jgi:FAD/FMN-containing dehydrogenase
MKLVLYQILSTIPVEDVMRIVKFSLLLAWTLSGVSLVFADAIQEYEKNLDEVNEKLRSLKNISSFCPGANLALSCGDLKCQQEKGENEATCPTDCSSALVRSYNSQAFCKEVKEIQQPETYLEVQNIIKQAAIKNTKVRVIGKAHSSNTQLCTDGVVISTEKLNRILDVEMFEGHETVRVEPGVSERELTEYLHALGKSIGYGLVGFRGISIGGIAATGAHGSSPKHSAILASNVQSMLIVTADGNITEFTEKTTDPELFKALRTHMGMLGVIIQMRIKIYPQFNLETKINFESDKVIFGKNNAIDLVKNCDFGQIHWFPSTKKIMKTCGIKTQKAADDGANNIYLNPYIPNELVTPYKIAFHYGACSHSFNALFEKLRFTISKWQPPLVKLNSRGNLVNSTDVIGPSHRMLSSELGLGRETLIVRDWEVAIPQSQVSGALVELKRYFTQKKLSLPITGVYLRFTPVEATTLISNATEDGHFRKNEIVTFIEFPAYYPIGFPPEKKEKYSQLYEEMTKILVEKFHGRPHWGKNNEAIFKAHRITGHERHLITRFKKLVKELDPKGIFANDFQELIFADIKSSPMDGL